MRRGSKCENLCVRRIDKCFKITDSLISFHCGRGSVSYCIGLRWLFTASSICGSYCVEPIHPRRALHPGHWDE